MSRKFRPLKDRFPYDFETMDATLIDICTELRDVGLDKYKPMLACLTAAQNNLREYHRPDISEADFLHHVDTLLKRMRAQLRVDVEVADGALDVTWNSIESAICIVDTLIHCHREEI